MNSKSTSILSFNLYTQRQDEMSACPSHKLYNVNTLISIIHGDPIPLSSITLFLSTSFPSLITFHPQSYEIDPSMDLPGCSQHG